MTHYRIADYTFDLHVEGESRELNSALGDALGAVLYAFESPHAPPKEVEPFTLTTAFGVMRCFNWNGRHHVQIELAADVPDDPARLLDAFEPEIINQAVRESPGYLWIHGACLTSGDERVLLVAESGTGKTTLSLGLLHYGYKLLTDDVILLNPQTGTVVPLLRCPKIRPTAEERLRGVGFDLVREAHRLGHYTVFPPERLQKTPLSLAPSRLYFLRRNLSEPSECHEIDLVSGLLGLLPCSNLLGVNPTMELAADLFRHTRFYEMNLHDYAVDLADIAGTAAPVASELAETQVA
jgi:hypothetical protein